MARTLILVILAVGVIAGALFLWRKGGKAPPSLSLSELRSQIIPEEGMSTTYGISLSHENAQLFADWYYEIKLSAAQEKVLRDALGSMPTPCCDDTKLTRCCCEEGGRICNLVRSARGLATWLIREKGFGAEEVRAAVEEWLRFIHPHYFLAQELKGRGADPAAHGLPTRGACYRGWCEVSLGQGGCGGMGLRVEL